MRTHVDYNDVCQSRTELVKSFDEKEYSQIQYNTMEIPALSDWH